MTPIEVTVRFAPDGRVEVLGFVTAGRSCPVEDTGRQWRDPDGLLHVLVRSYGQVRELVMEKDGRWLLRSRPSVPRRV